MTTSEVLASTPAPHPLVADRKMWRVSREELDRRWRVVRDHLVANGLQALVVQGYEEKIGGPVRWLTDSPPGYTRTVIFHVNDWMTLVDHGPQGAIKRLDDRDPDRPGVGELVTNWALFAGHFTSGLAAQSVATVLSKRGYSRVGIAGGRSMAHGFISDLRASLSDVVFTDETEFFDLARARKSNEELAMLTGTAAIQDEVFTKLCNWMKPGMRDFEINAYVDYQLQLLGADRGVYIGVSAPLGEPAVFGYRHFQGRTMQAGDHMNILLESNGPGGMWTEMSRLVAFGKVPDKVREAHDVCVEAQALTARMSVPGADPAEIFATHNLYLGTHGSEAERRLHSHGQGYDAVERPFLRSDETMRLEGNMCISIHPAYVAGKTFATICDNYVISGTGAGYFLHKTPKRIFELG